MPHLSTQITSIVDGGDDGWGILYKARSREERGLPVLMLAMGDHDFPTPAPIRAACQAALDAGKTGYGSISGIPPLRAAIAARGAAVHGIPIAADQIVLASGGQAALGAACRAVLDQGDEAIILEPHYATYAQTVRAAGGSPVIIGTSPEAGFQPDASRIAAAITKRTRMILLNSPNNPTGAVYSRESLQAVCDLCLAHDLWLISDEVYHSQIYKGRHLSPASLKGMQARCFIIDSLSKSHAMTGWRAGWVICPDAHSAERIADLFLTASYGLAPFIQDAMRHAIEQGTQIEAEIGALYEKRRAIALDALAKSDRLTLRAPDAAMYVFIDLRAFCEDGRAFADTLLERYGVAAMPGESFGDSGKGHLRISLTCAEDQLAQACAHIAALAQEWR